MFTFTSRQVQALIVSRLLPGDLSKYTSGHSVGSFVLSQILYGQSDPIRLSLLTFLLYRAAEMSM